MKNLKSKGIFNYLIAFIGFALALAFVILLSVVPRTSFFQEQFVIQKGVNYQTEFASLLGEVNQLLYVGDFSSFDNLNSEILGAENKPIDNRLVGWLSLYLHAKESGYPSYRLVNERGDPVSVEELGDILQERLSRTTRSVLPQEIFYRVEFEDIFVENLPDKEVESFGTVLLPVVAPGEYVGFFEVLREETLYNVVLGDRDG